MGVVEKTELNKEFKLLFEKIFPSLHLYCNSFLRDTAKSEDIVQNAFIKLWGSEVDISNINKVKSYLYQTVKNECLNEIRHDKVLFNYFDHQKGDIDVVFNDEIIKQETYNIVYEAINKLAPQTRNVILLTLKGYGYKEIADDLNISVNTVKLLKRNGMKKLKGILKDYFYLFLCLLPVDNYLF